MVQALPVAGGIWEHLLFAPFEARALIHALRELRELRELALRERTYGLLRPSSSRMARRTLSRDVGRSFASTLLTSE